MKTLLTFILGIVLFSCAENSKKNLAEDTSDTIELSESETSDEMTPLKRIEFGIPVYNFPALDEALLHKDNDSTYIVNFWATWCKPCVKEMPYFEKIAETYAEDKVKVIFVSLDFPDRLGTQVVPFIEKNNIRSEVVLLDDDDANSWIPKVSTKWQGAIPATVIYTKDKRAFFERSFTYEELEKEVQSLL